MFVGVIYNQFLSQQDFELLRDYAKVRFLYILKGVYTFGNLNNYKIDDVTNLITVVWNLFGASAYSVKKKSMFFKTFV